MPPSDHVPSSSSTWLHQESVLKSSVGVTYGVRYIGKLAVLASMRELDFQTRSLLTRQCIARVCEAAGLPLEKRILNLESVQPQIWTLIADTPNLVNGGTQIILSITSTHLTMISTTSHEVMAQHELMNVSFTLANPGVPGQAKTSPDQRYAAFVVNHQSRRWCMVLECGDRAAEVISTIGQAFEVLYRDLTRQRILQFQTKSVETNASPIRNEVMATPRNQTGRFAPTAIKQSSSATTVIRPISMPLQSPNDSVSDMSTPTTSTAFRSFSSATTTILRSNTLEQVTPIAPLAAVSTSTMPSSPDEPNYYNDAPNLVPPPVDVALFERVTSKPRVVVCTPDPWRVNGVMGQAGFQDIDDQSISINISTASTVDLNDTHHECFYNDADDTFDSVTTLQDSNRPLTRSVAFSNLPNLMSEQDMELFNEPWFHGVITREEAEARLENSQNGDFLVRISRNTAPGQQYVLTTYWNNLPRHLLLQQENGMIVASDDQMFTSVGHLINYCIANDMALKSVSGELVALNRPIRRPNSAVRMISR